MTPYSTIYIKHNVITIKKLVPHTPVIKDFLTLWWYWVSFVTKNGYIKLLLGLFKNKKGTSLWFFCKKTKKKGFCFILYCLSIKSHWWVWVLYRDIVLVTSPDHLFKQQLLYLMTKGWEGEFAYQKRNILCILHD